MKSGFIDVVSYQAGYDEGRESILESEEVRKLVEALELTVGAAEVLYFYYDLSRSPEGDFKLTERAKHARSALAKFEELKKKVMGDV